jgi:hypothetical protein
LGDWWFHVCCALLLHRECIKLLLLHHCLCCRELGGTRLLTSERKVINNQLHGVHTLQELIKRRHVKLRLDTNTLWHVFQLSKLRINQTGSFNPIKVASKEGSQLSVVLSFHLLRKLIDRINHIRLPALD